MNAIVSLEAGALPQQHPGTHYNEVIARLSALRNVKRYLEVGVQRGITFSGVKAEIAFGVDPEFIVNANVAANKKQTRLFQMTSDEFFRDVDVVAEFGGHPDMCFLDGMHLFEYLLRDFYNTERISSRNTLICLHDCLPLNHIMAHRSMDFANQNSAHTAYPGWWTGDVWKIVPILQKYRPDLRVMLVDAPPTGLVFVTNLDPQNTVLRDNYLDIVRDYFTQPNDQEAIIDHYRSNNVFQTDAVLADMNHSLFFNT
jgi:hypothetical protein